MLRTLLAGAALQLLLLGSGCGPMPDGEGHLAVSPELVRLPAVAEGGAVSAPLALMNLGARPVQVTHVGLAASSGYDVRGPSLPFQLGAGEQARLELQYRPGAGVPVTNSLEVESDGDPAVVHVELSALPAPALLALIPGSIDFGAVASSGTEDRIVMVQNVGLGPAESLRLEWLQGRADFSAHLSAGRIAASATAELRISYTPRGGDADEALLRLRWEAGQKLLRIRGRQDLQAPD